VIWAEHVVRKRVTRNALVRKPEEKRPIGKPRCRWGNNIRMEIREIGCEGVDWIHLAQDRDQWRAVVNMMKNLQVS
jgi:hypothetical protein